MYRAICCPFELYDGNPMYDWNRIRIHHKCIQLWLIGDKSTLIQIKAWRNHYIDVMIGVIASQITSLTIVYSTVTTGADQGKHQSSASLAFVWVIYQTGEFPAQMASDAENVSIWWRHHDKAAGHCLIQYRRWSMMAYGVICLKKNRGLRSGL